MLGAGSEAGDASNRGSAPVDLRSGEKRDHLSAD